jgi:PPOX class probable F420-dependent enzyme
MDDRTPDTCAILARVTPDLLDARVIATLATVDGDGLPYLSSVWFLRDGGDVLVATGGSTRKARNAAARPVAGLLLHGRGEVPLHGVAASGPVEVVRGADARALNERVWRKYLTAAGRFHPELGGRIAAHDDVTLRITPGPWRSWGTDADFAGVYELPGLIQPLDPTGR